MSVKCHASWSVVFGAFLGYFIADGWAYSFGALYAVLLDQFQDGKGKTAIIGALVYGVPLLISPFVCAFVSVYGCRPACILGGVITGLSFTISTFATSIDFLCVTTGFLASVGLALTYISCLVCVTQHFERHRGLATGLAVTGSGLGAFAFPPLVQFIVDEYSWRGTFLVIGAISFHICLAGVLLIPHVTGRHVSEGKTTSRPYSDNSNGLKKLYGDLRKTLCDNSIPRTLSFLIFCASTFVLYLWVGTPYVYLVDYVTTAHDAISQADAAFLLSIIGICRAVGQVLLGVVGDLPQVNVVTLYTVTIFGVGLSVLVTPWCSSYATLAVACVVFGLCVASTYTLQMMSIVRLVGLEQSTHAFGFYQLVQGVATVLGTPVAGWLYDATGIYSTSFYAAGGAMLLSAAMLLPLHCWKSVAVPVVDTEPCDLETTRS